MFYISVCFLLKHFVKWVCWQWSLQRVVKHIPNLQREVTMGSSRDVLYGSWYCEESRFFPHPTLARSFFSSNIWSQVGAENSTWIPSSLIGKKIQFFPPECCTGSCPISSYWTMLKPVNSLAVLLFFIYFWGENMSNGQIALPETGRLCQTKKIKARHCYNHTACESAGCTGESGPACSCTLPWHSTLAKCWFKA